MIFFKKTNKQMPREPASIALCERGPNFECADRSKYRGLKHIINISVDSLSL